MIFKEESYEDYTCNIKFLHMPKIINAILLNWEAVLTYFYKNYFHYSAISLFPNPRTKFIPRMTFKRGMFHHITTLPTSLEHFIYFIILIKLPD